MPPAANFKKGHILGSGKFFVCVYEGTGGKFKLGPLTKYLDPALFNRMEIF